MCLSKRGGEEGSWVELAQDHAHVFGSLILELILRVLHTTSDLIVADLVKTELKQMVGINSSGTKW
jgi:hypothetical protein